MAQLTVKELNDILNICEPKRLVMYADDTLELVSNFTVRKLPTSVQSDSGDWVAIDYLPIDKLKALVATQKPSSQVAFDVLADGILVKTENGAKVILQNVSKGSQPMQRRAVEVIDLDADFVKTHIKFLNNCKAYGKLNTLRTNVFVEDNNADFYTAGATGAFHIEQKVATPPYPALKASIHLQDAINFFKVLDTLKIGNMQNIEGARGADILYGESRHFSVEMHYSNKLEGDCTGAGATTSTKELAASNSFYNELLNIVSSETSITASEIKSAVKMCVGEFGILHFSQEGLKMISTEGGITTLTNTPCSKDFKLIINPKILAATLRNCLLFSDRWAVSACAKGIIFRSWDNFGFLLACQLTKDCSEFNIEVRDAYKDAFVG